MKNREKGIALIMTLWVMVLLTAIAMSFSFSSRRGSASTRNLKEDTQAYYLALSAYEEAVAYLLTDPDPTVDYIDEEGNFRTDAERPPFEGPVTIEGADVEIRITDEESRLNINTLAMDQLIAMFVYAGIPDDERQALADSLIDWKDPDDEHHLSGAENEYYENFGYSTKNKPLDMPEELLLVKGFTKEMIYGGGTSTPLINIITTYGTGLNINTVPVDILRILGVPDDIIANLVINRSAPGGTKVVPPQLGTYGRTRSSNFRIQIVARMHDNPLAVRITSVVSRQFGTNNAAMLTRYWKEDIESSRT